jgi:predicted nucleotidyltransferase
MNSTIAEIARNVLKRNIHKNTLGILLFGSAARNTFDKFSDVDIYILEKSKPHWSRMGYTIDGILIDIIVDDKKTAWNFLLKEQHHIQRNFSHMLAHGEILYSLGNELSMLQSKARNNLKLKTVYTRDEILMHLYSIQDFYGEVLRFHKSKNVVAFEQSCILLINNVLECFLKLKGEYSRRPNEIYEVLEKRDGKFARAFRSYYRQNHDQGKLEKLKVLIAHIYILAGGPLPLEWRVR